jgi:predicted Fe-Mo cluster-binding NifX family protein
MANDAPFRVAFASNDGRTVDCHFGRAEQFVVYSVAADGFAPLEVRTLGALCGGGEHSDERLEAIVEALGDCHMVLALRFGPPVQDLLDRRGIRYYAMHGEIEPLLGRLVSAKRERPSRAKSV